MIGGQTGCPLCVGIASAIADRGLAPDHPAYGLHGGDALVGAFFLGVCIERVARDRGVNVVEMLCAPHVKRVRELSNHSIESGYVAPENRHIVATGPHLVPVK